MIVTVGRQEFQKAHVDLVSAFDLIAESRPDVELVLVGRSGNQSREVEACVARSPYHDRIHMLGHRDDVPDILAAADLFALPSLYEGFPRRGSRSDGARASCRCIATADAARGRRGRAQRPARPAARTWGARGGDGRVARRPEASRRLGDRGRERSSSVHRRTQPTGGESSFTRCRRSSWSSTMSCYTARTCPSRVRRVSPDPPFGVERRHDHRTLTIRSPALSRLDSHYCRR